MALCIRPFVFKYPSKRRLSWPALNMTAKCYRSSNISSPVDGLTLFFLHCNSAHKEQWEPIIEFLFSQSGSNHLRIREAWAFDSPTHGDSGILNRELLRNRTENISLYDWVSGVVQFFRSNYMRGHRVVLCGHSAGATTALVFFPVRRIVQLNQTSALIAAEFYPNLASVGIIGQILVESAMLTPAAAIQEDTQARWSRMLMLSSCRKDSWNSRKDALLYFQNKRPWSRWDPRVLSLYIEYGLYEHPDRRVSLKCEKIRESSAFADKEPHFDGIACFEKLCSAIPSHIIWGERQDFVVDSIQAALSDTSQGRLPGSVTKVEEAGHMVVQEQPIRLAQIICRILETMSTVSAERSSL